MALFTTTTGAASSGAVNKSAPPIQPFRTQTKVSTFLPIRIKFRKCKTNNTYRIICSSSSSSSSIPTTTKTPDFNPSSSSSSPSSSSSNGQSHWIVVMQKPPKGVCSKPEIIDYYVKTLARVLGSEQEAQLSVYNASLETHFGFCCDIDEETSRELARLPEVLSVRPDREVGSEEKGYNYANLGVGNMLNSDEGTIRLFLEGSSKYWIIRVEKPSVGVVTKAQMVDYYVKILAKVLGNEKDAEMCIYHMSWQNNLGFCCELNDDCAQELAGVPAILSVRPDENFGSEIKDYGGGDNLQNSSDPQATNIKTKRLFVTGLSFYTSEKTLRAAFEGFGELVEVKIIMDKISKRSKGYAFLEYTTEEAAATALKEMNGKIINGWMIVVDVAKTNPPKYNRGRPRPTA